MSTWTVCHRVSDSTNGREYEFSLEVDIDHRTIDVGPIWRLCRRGERGIVLTLDEFSRESGISVDDEIDAAEAIIFADAESQREARLADLRADARAELAEYDDERFLRSL